jgi:hypothetical protein
MDFLDENFRLHLMYMVIINFYWRKHRGIEKKELTKFCDISCTITEE